MKNRFTHEQASELLGKAARMEANHGQEPQSFLDLDEVKEAARAAGIDPRWVEAALLATGESGQQSTFWGIPDSVAREVVLDDPIDEEEWGRLIMSLRRDVGLQGTVERLGNNYTWEAAPYRLTVVNGQGGASVRIEANWRESLEPIPAIGATTLGFGAFLALTGMGSGEYVPTVLGAILLVTGLLFAVGPAIGYRRKARKAKAQIERMLEMLASIQSVPPTAAREVGDPATTRNDFLQDTLIEESSNERAPATQSRTRA